MSADTHTQSLPLPASDAPFNERDAWALCPYLSKKYTFEQAMSIELIAIALRGSAESMRRRQATRTDV